MLFILPLLLKHIFNPQDRFNDHNKLNYNEANRISIIIIRPERILKSPMPSEL